MKKMMAPMRAKGMLLVIFVQKGDFWYWTAFSETLGSLSLWNKPQMSMATNSTVSTAITMAFLTCARSVIVKNLSLSTYTEAEARAATTRPKKMHET